MASNIKSPLQCRNEIAISRPCNHLCCSIEQQGLNSKLTPIKLHVPSHSSVSIAPGRKGHCSPRMALLRRSASSVLSGALRSLGTLAAALPATEGQGQACIGKKRKAEPELHSWQQRDAGVAWRRPFAGRVISANSQRSYGSAAAELATEPGTSYSVAVVTGDVRGAGTHAAAAVTLYGEHGVSEDFILGDADADCGFERGSQQRYQLEVGRDLGALKRIHVRQLMPSASETGTGWYLDTVTVVQPDGETTNFPCHAWLGKPDSGDTSAMTFMERNLIPCASDYLAQATAASPGLARPLRIAASAVAVPHPEKVRAGGQRAVNRKQLGWAGEDAYFAASGPTGIAGFGVADGVYMWREQGIDAGEFSRSLIREALQCVQHGKPDVLKVLQAAARRTGEARVQGSSTCCLVLVDSQTGRLTSANVGDSGFVLLGAMQDRQDMHVKFRSPQQEHEFGRPYQLGHLAEADTAEDAMLMTLPTAPGDVLVLGSDGLFDNVADDQILSEVHAKVSAGQRPAQVAQHLTSVAFNNSLDKHMDTPYSAGATEAFDMVYSGGKQDDITVLVAFLD